jgi:glycerol-3-phosphate dehydrogenase (NAD(P)+)
MQGIEVLKQAFENIYIAGAGSIGTALGNALARSGVKVTLYTIEEDVARSVNGLHINQEYFPNALLSEKLMATTRAEELQQADILFLAIPSVITVDFVLQNKEFISDETVLVNLAKGFGCGRMTIAACLQKMVANPVCTLKGPTFAREIMNGAPTAMTFAAHDPLLFEKISSLFAGTPLYLDYTDDVEGVEFLSILKNIYAIILGIVDANFDSPNLRFLVLTRAFAEMRKIMLLNGGEEGSLFHYCGYGDFGLTALNNLSRNRTLGLLIGKGFFTRDISDKVVLEGKMAVNIICNEILKEEECSGFPLICELNRIFMNNYDVSAFVGNILKTMR